MGVEVIDRKCLTEVVTFWQRSQGGEPSQVAGTVCAKALRQGVECSFGLVRGEEWKERGWEVTGQTMQGLVGLGKDLVVVFFLSEMEPGRF